jgi:hypothetical protein
MPAMSELLPGRSYLALGEIPEIEVLPIDRLLLDAVDLAVKELRAGLVQAQQRPYGQRRLFVITNAHELSEIHQNTLLKLLEEPPAFLTIVLQADSAETFLPTVRSRLHVYKSPLREVANVPAWPENEAAIVKILQDAKDRSSLILLLKQQLRVWLGRVSERETGERLGIMEQAIVKLDRNCNQKLVIDWLLLHWFE